MARGQGSRDGQARILETREADHRRGAESRQRHQLDDYFGDDAQRSLGADEELQQPITRSAFAELAAEPHDAPVGQDHSCADHVIGGDAVFDASHAARVAGVGRIHEAVLVGGPVQGGRYDASAGGGNRVGPVDLEPGQPLEADHDAPRDGDRPADQTGAATARDDRHTFGGALADNRGDLLGVRRPHGAECGGFHEGRVMTVLVHALTLEEVLGTDDRAQAVGQRLRHRSNAVAVGEADGRRHIRCQV